MRKKAPVWFGFLASGSILVLSDFVWLPSPIAFDIEALYCKAVSLESSSGSLVLSDFAVWFLSSINRFRLKHCIAQLLR